MRGTWRKCFGAASNESEGPRSAEELAKIILGSCVVITEGGAGREDPKLRMVWIQSKPFIQNSEDISYLGSGRSAVGVQFVDDKMEDIRRLLEPTPRGGEYLLFNIPH